MQKYSNQRVFPCIFEQKTISEQIDLILAHVHCASIAEVVLDFD